MGPLCTTECTYTTYLPHSREKKKKKKKHSQEK